MLCNDSTVRMGEHYGYVRKFVHASQGRRWWAVDWEDGTSTVAAEDLMVDVDREEHAYALDHDLSEVCESRNRFGGRCGLKAGHRSRRHRSAEISWTDEMAVRS